MTLQERRARERQAVRARILDAAHALYVAGGEAEVTMRRVAERVEYSTPVLYQHFADKHALLRAVCELEWRALTDRLHEAAAGLADPVALLRAAGRAYVDFALTHADSYRLLFMVPLPPEARRDRTHRGDPALDSYAWLRDAVAALFRTGRVRAVHAARPDAEGLVAHALWQGLHGVIAMHLARGDDGWAEPLDPRAVAALAVDLLLDGLLEPAAA